MTAPLLTITVHSAPATQGSKTRTRYGMRDDNADTLKPWREAVKWAALDLLKDWDATRPGGLPLAPDDRERIASTFPLAGPVRVEVTFTLNKPGSAPKTRRTWPVKQRSGDIDKLTRAIFDSLTDAGVWGDDAQVVEVLARKTYPNEHPDALHVPGALIRIWPITEETSWPEST